MAYGTRFLPHSVQLKTGSVDTWINQIQSVAPDQGMDLFLESAGSEIAREFVATKAVKPKLPINTSDLTILSTIGMSGVFVVPASGKPGLVAFGRCLPLGGTPDAIATASHLKCTISDGLIIPISLRASHNASAMLQLLMHATLGTTATYSKSVPMLWEASQQITSGAGALTNLFTTGVVKFNSRLVKGILDINVNFGIQVLNESSDGDVYDSQIAIIGQDPVIEFTTRDAALAAEVGDGLSVSSGGGVYFRKITQDGQRVAEATTSHVGITFVDGMIKPGALNLQHKQADSHAFTIYPSKNSSLLGISVAAAIPTS